MNKVVFWDFDGTLSYRSTVFGSSLIMAMDEYKENHQMTEESFIPLLRGKFPWHETDKSYVHLRETESWWANIYKVLEQVFSQCGIPPEKAYKYARATRKYVIGPEYYSLFDDTLDTLRFFKENGYRNIILSNHIPELPEIAESLGLMELVEICITSAKVGFEKPNPQIFRYALELTGHPEELWMVGDNIVADVGGAEAVGMKAILVRKPPAGPVKYYSPDLKGTIGIIAGNH